MRLHSDVLNQVLKNAVKKFIGKIMQLPPVRSRVKRAIREREIISFDILEHEGKDVLFKTEVQAGTYIRKLIHDLGEQIGGAHMLELRRINAGIFSEENSVNLYDFEKAVAEYKKGNEELLRRMLIPAEIISEVLPVVQAEESSIKQLLVGKPITKKDIKGSLPKEEKFVLFNKNRFIGVYRKSEEGDIIARPEFVFN